MRDSARSLLDGVIAAQVELYCSGSVCAEQHAQERRHPLVQLHRRGRVPKYVDTIGSNQIAVYMCGPPKARRNREARKADTLVAVTTRRLSSSRRCRSSGFQRPRRVARLWDRQRAGSMLIASANRGMEWVVKRAKYYGEYRQWQWKEGDGDVRTRRRRLTTTDWLTWHALARMWADGHALTDCTRAAAFGKRTRLIGRHCRAERLFARPRMRLDHQHRWRAGRARVRGVPGTSMVYGRRSLRTESLDKVKSCRDPLSS